MNDRHYSTRAMCSMTGITFRQADYWARLGIVVPKNNGSGSGTARRWSYEQVRIVAFLRCVAEVTTDGNRGGRSLAVLRPMAEQLADDPTLLDQPGLYADLRDGVVSTTRRPFAVWLPDWSYAVDVTADLVPAIPA